MDKRVSYGLSIIILIIISFFLWHGFDFAPVFMGKTEKTNGYVHDIKDARGIKGYGYKQSVRFYYFFNGRKFHGGFFATKINYGKRQFGDSLLLEVSLKDPSNYKIKGIYEVTKIRGKAKHVHLRAK